MATQPRNIIILCADEFRGDMLGVSGFNPDIRTPHLDNLAGRGVLFRRHFTPFPKCVPARISMMTGRYPHTDGYRTISQRMPFGNPDLASHLQANGYQLAELGRNHCWEFMLEASQRPPTLQPGQRGLVFDEHAWTPGPMRDIWESHKCRAQSQTRDADDGVPATLAEGRGFVSCDDQTGWWGDEAVTEQACHYLAHVRDPARPCFLWVNLGKPHPPYNVGRPWFDMYDRETMHHLPYDLPRNAPYCLLRQREIRTGVGAPPSLFRAIQSTYMGMCSRIDELLGRAIQCIERLGMFEDSVVIFTSDHGDFAGQYGLPEKWDTVFSDALVHVPCVICAPTLTAGVTIDHLTDHTDLAPTLCSLIGIEPFSGIHGSSMLPTLKDHAIRDAVFADGGHEAAMRERFNAYQMRGRPLPQPDPETGRYSPSSSKHETYRRYPQTMARAKMIRTDRWKYVHREAGDHELYDLSNDPGETINLFPEQPDPQVLLDLRSRLIDWCLATDTDRPYQHLVGA